MVPDPTDKAALLTETLKIQGSLSKDASWVALETKVVDATKKNIEALGITGIGFDPEDSSFYPEASSAAQLLGFVGKDQNGGNIGYFGLEGYYDLPLSGKPGFFGSQKNALGAPIISNDSTQVTAIPGVTLETGIDKRIQTLIENQLAAGIQKYGALGGSVTVMDPISGKIMAMASLPW